MSCSIKFLDNGRHFLKIILNLPCIIVNEIKHSINICDKELNKEKDRLLKIVREEHHIQGNLYKNIFKGRGGKEG